MLAGTVCLQIFLVQRFCENVDNHTDINFRDKIFVILHSELTPIVELHLVLKFCKKIFCNWKSNHEIHRNIVQQKFGGVRYTDSTLTDKHKLSATNCTNY